MGASIPGWLFGMATYLSGVAAIRSLHKRSGAAMPARDAGGRPIPAARAGYRPGTSVSAVVPP